ncbi:MAG: hypothetical protein II433_09990 [Acidaminococcaceae bacterium]|nr:hypothetical protein [Acidaminococcaceae bacterium]
MAEREERTIGQLPALEELNDEALIPTEQSGIAYKMTGAQIKGFAQASAATEANRATSAADRADQTAAQMEQAIVNPPYIGTNGNWYIYSTASSRFVDSGYSAYGQAPTISSTPISGGNAVTFTGGNSETINVMDGDSPTVTVTNISGGHRVTIVDASHPSGQTFDVVDGAGSGDMKASVYDSDSSVANAGGISAYVSAHAPSVTVDETPTSGSSNPVSSGGTYTAVHATKPVTEGGTGATSGAVGLYNLINAATALSSSGVADGDYVGILDTSATTGKKVTIENLKSVFSGSGVSFQKLTTEFTLSNDDIFATAVVCGGKALVIVNISAGYDSSSTTHDFKIYGVTADNPNTTCGWIAIPDGWVSVKLRSNGSNYSSMRVAAPGENNAVGTVFFIASTV